MISFETTTFNKGHVSYTQKLSEQRNCLLERQERPRVRSVASRALNVTLTTQDVTRESRMYLPDSSTELGRDSIW